MVDRIKVIEAEDNLDEPIDTADPIKVNEARKKYARTRADRLRFVEAAMTTVEGRAWFYDTLVRCKVVATPFENDAFRTAFNCGMQNIGLQLMQDIQDAAPENYIKMISESRKKN